MLIFRVDTVLDCDHVLVMSGGRVTEAGSPKDLLQVQGGQFRALVEASQRNGGHQLVEQHNDDDPPLELAERPG